MKIEGPDVDRTQLLRARVSLFLPSRTAALFTPNSNDVTNKRTYASHTAIGQARMHVRGIDAGRARHALDDTKHDVST